MEVSLVNQGPVGGEVRDAQGRSLGEAQRGVQPVDALVSGHGELCITAGLSGHGEHPVSCLEDTHTHTQTHRLCQSTETWMNLFVRFPYISTSTCVCVCVCRWANTGPR